MRASLSFVLALLLAATPILQVHGQVRQQGSSPPDSSAGIALRTSDARSVVVLEPPWASWVPTLEPNGSPINRDSLSAAQPTPTSAGAWVAIVVVILLLLGGLIAAALCSGGGQLC